MHIFTFELDTSPYPALHEIIHATEQQNYTLLCEIAKNEDNAELVIAFYRRTCPFGQFWGHKNGKQFQI